jgi:hypothetical protein
MPHSIFFMKDGHAIHGSYEVKNLGNPLSHGCVRISPGNAATLYALVAKNGLENTQVVLSGTTPGGEFKIASATRPGARYSQANYGRNETGENYYNQPQTRLSFFGNLFSGQSYSGDSDSLRTSTLLPTARILKTSSALNLKFRGLGGYRCRHQRSGCNPCR